MKSRGVADLLPLTDVDTSKPKSIDEICELAVKLPCSPAVLPKLMAALCDNNNTAAEVERVIKLDSALAGATLRLANSAYFGGEQHIETVSDAVITLGQKELYRLASITLLNRWEEAHAKSLPWEPGDYSRHSICTAIAAEVLAEHHGRENPEVAYTSGLVCDIGKLVLAYFCSSFYPAISERAMCTGCTWEKAEEAVIGFNHSDVGSLLLSIWNFPEELSEAVRFQFNPDRADPPIKPMLALLHAARYVAVCLGPGVTEGGFLFQLHGDFLAEHGYTNELIEMAMIEVKDRFTKRMGGKATGFQSAAGTAR